MLNNDTTAPVQVHTELPAGVSFPLTLAADSDRLLTRKETARLLRLSEGYLRHMGPKLLPTVRLGTAVRHRVSDVIALIERRTVTAGDESERLPAPAGPGSPGQAG